MTSAPLDDVPGVPVDHVPGVPVDHVPSASPDDVWLRSYAARLGAAVRPGASVGRVTTPSGALVAHLGDVVVKVHHPRADPAALAARLAVVTGLAAYDLFVQPLAATATIEPATRRLVTAWPTVEVLDPDDDDLPWAAAGALLARLHRTAPPRAERAPAVHGGAERLARAVRRVGSLPVSYEDRHRLGSLGARLVAELGEVGERSHPAGPAPTTLVHGDWHLGQLARVDGGWRLLDIDDVGLGDPAWDLGRPAGFWAAGLLGDGDWHAFLAGYRASGGPGVPPDGADGDPWPRLDLAARCAVFVATVRELGSPSASSENSASDLLQACARM
ncbi:phosphotransferase family protein [Humibacillus xanthopallidus]|uniref:phosphotransferase family protein n=1 Tax=Humibacillus xanthopallidus TaxID=412689 RepID=UPI00384B5F14